MCQGDVNKDIKCHIYHPIRLFYRPLCLLATSVGMNILILAVLRDNDLKLGRQMVYFLIYFF